MAAKKAAATAEKVANNDKKAAIDTVISRIERGCGKGAIMRLGESGPGSNIDVISTGFKNV